MKLIECPRDAMQGLHAFIPTDTKARYINQLLAVGFDTIDFGSFVSPKAIPQLRDTADVLAKLELSAASSKLLAIIANERGARDACNFDEIDYLGFPFSISETFQQRNTNSSIEESLSRVEAIQDLCEQHNKQLVIYISMAFGNPYGDPWSGDVAIGNTEKLVQQLGVRIVALADTIGVSNPQNIEELFTALIPAFPEVEFGAHLHSAPHNWREKVQAALAAGCKRFDAAIKGFGGCPMAKDELVGNMATENLVSELNAQDIAHGLNTEAFGASMAMAQEVFPL